MCQPLLFSIVTELYIHTDTSFLKYSFPLCFIPGDWTQFPVLHTRPCHISTQNEIVYIYQPQVTVHLFPPLPLGNHKSNL